MIQSGCTVNKNTPVGATYITLNHDAQGRVFEVFVQTGKTGSEITSISEAFGRAISLLLQIPSELSPERRLEMLIDQFSGVGGSNSVGIGKHKVRSLPDGIAQGLRVLLDDHGKQHPEPAIESTTQSASVLSGVTSKSVSEFVQHNADKRDVDLCPECLNATYVREGGCCLCKTCGYSACG